MAKRTNGLFVNIWNNFVHGMRGKPKVKCVGSDYLGNKYYEIVAEPTHGKKRPSRWFENDLGQSGFDSERPAEWDSWLRFRRNEPPNDEEVSKNLAISQMKKINAAELDKKYFGENNPKSLPTETKGPASFPKYDEYH